MIWFLFQLCSTIWYIYPVWQYLFNNDACAGGLQHPQISGLATGLSIQPIAWTKKSDIFKVCLMSDSCPRWKGKNTHSLLKGSFNIKFRLTMIHSENAINSRIAIEWGGKGCWLKSHNSSWRSNKLFNSSILPDMHLVLYFFLWSTFAVLFLENCVHNERREV